MPFGAAYMESAPFEGDWFKARKDAIAAAAWVPPDGDSDMNDADQAGLHGGILYGCPSRVRTFLCARGEMLEGEADRRVRRASRLDGERSEQPQARRRAKREQLARR